jgi:hypothetical protein
MTTLTKNAAYDFLPGSPFVPAQTVVTCINVPDLPAPPNPCTGRNPPAYCRIPPPQPHVSDGLPRNWPKIIWVVGPNGQIIGLPYCESGRIDTLTGRCL